MKSSYQVSAKIILMLLIYVSKCSSYAQFSVMKTWKGTHESFVAAYSLKLQKDLMLDLLTPAGGDGLDKTPFDPALPSLAQVEQLLNQNPDNYAEVLQYCLTHSQANMDKLTEYLLKKIHAEPKKLAWYVDILPSIRFSPTHVLFFPTLCEDAIDADGWKYLSRSDAEILVPELFVHGLSPALLTRVRALLQRFPSSLSLYDCLLRNLSGDVGLFWNAQSVVTFNAHKEELRSLWAQGFTLLDRSQNAFEIIRCAGFLYSGGWIDKQQIERFINLSEKYYNADRKKYEDYHPGFYGEILGSIRYHLSRPKPNKR